MKNNKAMRTKNFMEELLNKGKKLEGVTGFVPCKVQCCSGGTKLYVPVVVKGVKIDGCSFALKVACISSDTINTKEEFTVDPAEFYNNKLDVEKHEAELAKWVAYNADFNPFEYHRNTLTRKRKLLKMLVEAMSGDLKDECIEAMGSEAEIKNVDNSFISEWASKLLKHKHGIQEEAD